MTTTSLALTPPLTSAAQERDRLLASFLLSLEAENRSPATARLYEYAVRQLFAFLQDMGLDNVPLSAVSPEHLRHFLAVQRRGGKAPATVESLHRGVRAFWRWLQAEGEISENVATRVPRPQVPEQVVEVITDAQLMALRRTCQRDRTVLGLRDSALIVTLLDTGLRASELLGLTIEGIDRKERRALVLGKGAKERIVCFESKTLRLLDRYWRRASITSGAILRDRTGSPLSSAALYLAMRRRGRQVGIEGLHPHAFRHYAASALLEAGMTEADVRVLMGWSRGSRMLERYTASRAAERALEARASVRLVR